ncbi:transmembrane protein 186-like [Argiope bruennichi]|uniref:transmembrane protein 186-like n=1 Tax=Argiope bruennichi TaxID=94029 RepID=UPI002493D29E|nr:transmembrane protein 186-like [Argiope bruennichi]
MFIITRLTVLTNFKIASNLLLKHKQIAKLNYVSCAAKSRLFQENKKSHDQNPWTPIYFFPYIRAAAVCSRFKLYQTAFTLAAVPWSISLYNDGLIEASSVGVISGCAMLACCTLYLLSYYFRRLIGVIFLSEDEKSVQISHLTFWGRKKDIIVPSQEIVPLADSACNPNDVYIKLKRYSCEDELYFTLKYGKILDKMKFEKVFGNLEILGRCK